MSDQDITPLLLDAFGARHHGARHPRKGHGVLRENAAMKYAWIERHRRHWPVSLSCEVLKVSISAYHERNHRDKARSTGPSGRISDDALLTCCNAISIHRRLTAPGAATSPASPRPKAGCIWRW